MAGTWRDYLSLMENLGQKMDELTGLERIKIQAVGSGDLETLDECMKKEQVISLSLRGMDQKRNKLMGELGITGVHLRDLVEHAPDDLKWETKEAAEKLRKKYDLFQSASSVARNTLECNLHAIEQAQKAQDVQPEEGPHRQADFRV
ncbi:MAG: hypothetical protein HDT15_02615 [Oscillibacter sp.]|nr:hypothetical protein [Oscillibacter sp.]MBD5153983.1 hypothetical protein [Oscillibacter sp.]